ncbi:hypothetical protein Pan54_16470 [Rubinisphaera italica]|uniref:Uncharacterized protein n=1 Tax=Rubinisphaera italica TaxID=2527969 RepID=A0A5C5XFI9_9PLAN|nr:hypothetical protein Pan54_16470 [Rubinisphaera italica]
MASPSTVQDSPESDTRRDSRFCCPRATAAGSQRHLCTASAEPSYSLRILLAVEKD